MQSPCFHRQKMKHWQRITKNTTNCGPNDVQNSRSLLYMYIAVMAKEEGKIDIGSVQIQSFSCMVPT